MDYIEYKRGPWRLRLVQFEDQTVEGFETEDNSDVVPLLFVWFVGRMDDDQWFAHGLSDFHDPSAADDVLRSIDGERMDVLLTLAGYTWEEIIETDIAALSQLQRVYANKINEDYWADLVLMGKTELEELRATEEHEHELRFRRN